MLALGHIICQMYSYFSRAALCFTTLSQVCLDMNHKTEMHIYECYNMHHILLCNSNRSWLLSSDINLFCTLYDRPVIFSAVHKYTHLT